jgi:hypothetical protein
LLIDMRGDWLASCILLIAAMGQGLAVGCRLGWLLPDGGSRVVMLVSGAEMTGGLMLMAAMILHVRYVIRDAEGLLPQCSPADADRENDCEAVDDELEALDSAKDHVTKIDLPHTIPQPAQQRAATSVGNQSGFANASATETRAVGRKLTKGERRALKERLLRERLERERRR